MTIDNTTLFSLTEEAIQILYREMGVVNTVRFLRQFHGGYGDYTSERRELNETDTLDEILKQIKQRREVDRYDIDTASEVRLDRIRQEYPRAYEKWTGAEDEELREKHAAGKNVPELATALGRQPGAILSRLRKLGLNP